MVPMDNLLNDRIFSAASGFAFGPSRVPAEQFINSIARCVGDDYICYRDKERREQNRRIRLLHIFYSDILNQ